MISRYRRLLYHLIIFLVFLVLSGCGGGNTAANPTKEPDAGLPPASSMPAEKATASPVVDAPLAGPLVGFYIEDFYEDVYLSIYDAGTGGLRVLQSGVPIYIGEAQWIDDGCRLFVHGQVTNLHGIPEWSIPQEVADQINNLATARLSPDRNWIAQVVPSGITTGQGATTADVEVISLTQPYSTARLTTHGGADFRALEWSADGRWLFFTDYDANGVLQIFRAAPDGSVNEQLTLHDGAIGGINGLVPSPDGRYLAYSVQNLVQATHPYIYQPADEGWVGILDLAAWTSAQVRPARFGSAESGRGIIWDAAGERLVIIGDSLPVAADDPVAGRRVIWAIATGEVERALTTADGPDGPDSQIGWIAPLGNIDTLLVGVRDAIYVYENGEFQRLEAEKGPAVGIDIGRRPVGIFPAPTGFPGEAACSERE